LTASTAHAEVGSLEPLDPGYLRKALSHYPTGVCAITSRSAEGKPLALVVGSFTSVSLDPPLIGFLPMKTSYAWQCIAQARRFGVNVLAADQQSLCQQLAGPVEQRFVGVTQFETAFGVPLLENATLNIECTLHETHDAGDHLLVLGRIQNILVSRIHDPLLFLRGGYGTFAPNRQD